MLTMKKSGPGQPPEPHRTWFPAWRNDRFSPAALEKECRICQSPLQIRHLSDHEPATATVGQRPCPAPRSRMGEEAATPGQPVALARVFWSPPGNSPSRITGCRWLCRNHPQAQELSRFAEPTLSQIVAPRNTKNLRGCAETVEDVSSLWKAEEN